MLSRVDVTDVAAGTPASKHCTYQKLEMLHFHLQEPQHRCITADVFCSSVSDLRGLVVNVQPCLTFLCAVVHCDKINIKTN